MGKWVLVPYKSIVLILAIGVYYGSHTLALFSSFKCGGPGHVLLQLKCEFPLAT